jgi:serine protease Do
VIVQFAGAAIKDVPDLQWRVARVQPGQRIPVTIVRDRASVRLTVTVGEMPADEPVAAADEDLDGFGLQVEPIADEAARRLDLRVPHGVLVSGVAAEGPANRAGLRGGDVILEVDRRAVVDAAALALAAVKPGASILMYVHRPGDGGRNQYLVLERLARP